LISSKNTVRPLYIHYVRARVVEKKNDLYPPQKAPTLSKRGGGPIGVKKK